MIEFFGFIITLIVVLFFTAILIGGVLFILGAVAGVGIGFMAIFSRLK